MHIFGLGNIEFLGFLPHPTEILGKPVEFVSIQTIKNYPSQSVMQAMVYGTVIIVTVVVILNCLIVKKWHSNCSRNKPSCKFD